jgi:hypothetical protein
MFAISMATRFTLSAVKMKRLKQQLKTDALTDIAVVSVNVPFWGGTANIERFEA